MKLFFKMDKEVTEEKLNRNIRAHGNFSEYVPLYLLLLLVSELVGVASSNYILIASLIFTYGRIAHAVCFAFFDYNPFLRISGMLTTYVGIAHYDRNFLRHEVLPLIESRWPGYRSGFARSATLSGELAASGHFDNLTEYTRYGGPYLPMDVHDAKSLHRALHGWLKELNAPLPDFVALEEFARQCMHAQGDKLPELRVGGYLLQRWRQGIHLYSGDIDCDFDISCEVGGALAGRWGSIVWQEADMGLPAGVSIRVRAPRHGEAVSLGQRPRRSVGQWHRGLR